MDANDVVATHTPAPHVAVVTLNRPDARNAVNGEVAHALGAMVEKLEASPEVRAVVLTGAGKAFCAGADLKAVAAGLIDELFTPAGGFAGFVRFKRSKPWIAALNGDALAGGLEIALSCDVILAAEGGRVGLPEVRRGLAASAGGLYRLARAIPRFRALELVATGRMIDVVEAAQMGLISRVTPQGELLDHAVALATEIAGNAPLAVQESLQVARQAFDHAEDELHRLSEAAQDRLRRTEDFYEGARAFVEKRPPNWLGR